MKLKALLIAAVASVAATSAFAQDAFDMQVTDSSLITMPIVQKELGISPVEAKEFGKIVQSYGPQLTKNPNQSATIRENMRKAMLAKLSAPQLRRLREISLQRFGPALLATPLISARVGVDANTKLAISDLYRNLSVRVRKATADAMEAAMAPYKDKNMTPRQQREMNDVAVRAVQSVNADNMRKETDRVAIGMLTEKQRNAWSALLGKPFDLAEVPAAPVLGGGRPPQP